MKPSVDKWSTPKRVSSMECSDHFVALTPEDKTFVDAGRDADELVEKLYSNTDKFTTKEHQGIFRSLGISDKLQTIHQETDEIVKSMLAEGINCSHNRNYQLSENKQLMSSPSYGPYNLVQKLTPSQASKCQDLFLAKDEIIEQKDIIMQKQKNMITQLRERNMELEEQLIRKEQVQLKSKNYDNLYQDYQRQIQTMKQEMNEAYSRKCTEVEKLQRKLGEKEYELGKLNIALKENNLNKENMMEKLIKEFEMNNQNLNVEKERNSSICAELSLLRQENKKLHSYLEELPTSEEFRKIKNELKQTSQERDDLFENKETCNKKYKDLKREFLQKENEFKKMQRATYSLKEELSCLTTTLEKYRTKAPITIEDHESKLSELVGLQKENKELRESLGKRQKKMTKLYYDYVSKQKDFDSQKEVLQGNMKELQEDINEKCISITKINVRNQELLTENLQVQSELKKFKARYSEEYEKLLSTLNSEIISCFDELKSFVELCTTMSKGEEPNLQSLLGLKDSPEKTKESSLSDTEAIKKKLEMIKGIRQEIDGLRHLTAERHAEELGKNMCVTQ